VKYGVENQIVHVTPRTNSKGELVVEIFGKSIGFDNTGAEQLFELGYRGLSGAIRRMASFRVAPIGVTFPAQHCFSRRTAEIGPPVEITDPYALTTTVTVGATVIGDGSPTLVGGVSSGITTGPAEMSQIGRAHV
jgi:hypothetical protein